MKRENEEKYFRVEVIIFYYGMDKSPNTERKWNVFSYHKVTSVLLTIVYLNLMCIRNYEHNFYMHFHQHVTT